MTLGVLGTMVWDTIEHPDGETVQRWGGITYALAAAAAACPAGWAVRPVIKLGRDLAGRAHAFLDSVPGLEPGDGVVEVDAPNNRVRLRYRDRQHRDEYLTGGVPGWGWEELAPRLDGLDGLYVNMISGFELDDETVGVLRDRFRRPRYVDLHALVFDVGPGGHRRPRRPPAMRQWLDGFHVVQANRPELEIAAGNETVEALATRAVADGTRAVLVTRGPEGARWFARSDGPVWGDRADEVGGVASVDVRSGEVRTAGVERGDPTGCGDVWGATCFVYLMRGRRLADAMAEANRAAARNMDHRGADGLHQHLRDA